MFCVLPLLKVPVATNCRLVPCAIVKLFGVTVIETRFAVSTVTVAVPMTPLYVAVIVTGVVVTATPVANPLVVIVTFVVSDDVHVATFVTSC